METTQNLLVTTDNTNTNRFGMARQDAFVGGVFVGDYPGQHYWWDYTPPKMVEYIRVPYPVIVPQIDHEMVDELRALRKEVRKLRKEMTACNCEDCGCKKK